MFVTEIMVRTRASTQARCWSHGTTLSQKRWLASSAPRRNLDAIIPRATQQWSHLPSSATISDHEISRLASLPRRPLTLADLVR